MVVDALLAAEPAMHFANHITKPERYLHLTDSILELIQMSDEKVSSLPPPSQLRLIVSRTSLKRRQS
jgi:hypothetical protein